MERYSLAKDGIMFYICSIAADQRRSAGCRSHRNQGRLRRRWPGSRDVPMTPKAANRTKEFKKIQARFLGLAWSGFGLAWSGFGPAWSNLARGVPRDGVRPFAGLRGTVGRKCCRKGLKRLISRPETLWPRKPRTDKLWGCMRFCSCGAGAAAGTLGRKCCRNRLKTLISAPGNAMAPEASGPQDMGTAAQHVRP